MEGESRTWILAASSTAPVADSSALLAPTSPYVIYDPLGGEVETIFDNTVRTLTFGPEKEFERYLGLAVAAFDIDGYRPRDELMAVTHTQVGVQALRFALRDGATMFCFTFRYDGEVPVDDVPAQQELLRTRLRDVGWEVPDILARMPEARAFYLDRASQIRMSSWPPSWTGRVGITGPRSRPTSDSWPSS